MAIPYPVSSDDELVRRIRAGDESAFDRLVREHYTGLCIFAARMLNSHAAAEEVVQDVLLRVWEQRDRWEVRGKISSYLYASVRNGALNVARRERLLHRWQQTVLRDGDVAEITSTTPDADEGVQEAELAAAVDRAVQELPPRCREVFILRRRHHLSCVEIARIMQITPKTVEIQVGIALKALRRKLAHLL